jgi:hypothetical protein
MRTAVLACTATLLLVTPLTVQGGVRDERPNLVSGELGGRGIIYSVNYERYLTGRVGIGAGLMGFGTSDGAVALIPLYVSLNPVGDTHSLYLAAGTTGAVGSANWEELESEWLGTFSAGYQYHSQTGFFVRPTLNIIYKGEDWLLLPGVAVGGSF